MSGWPKSASWIRPSSTLLRNAPRQPQPMDVLRTAVSALSFYDPEEKNNDHEANVHKAIRLTSQIAMIVAAYDRIRKGEDSSRAGPSLSHAANFLLMLNGKHPSQTAERALDIALILHADHELNASTFAARVTAATLVRHAFRHHFGDRRAERPAARRGQRGGVPHSEGDRQIGGRPRRVREGHAGAEEERFPASAIASITPKIRAPRTCARCRAIWAIAAARAKWFEMSHKIEEFVKAEKKLNANVDFYSASTYHTLGIDVDLFTPVFAVSRISGWAAHVIEQLDDNRLIRPRAEYLGPAYPTHYVPIDQR